MIGVGLINMEDRSGTLSLDKGDLIKNDTKAKFDLQIQLLNFSLIKVFKE